MKRMGVLALAVVLLAAVRGDSAETAKEKYHVLSRFCKGFALVGSYDSVSAAFWAGVRECNRYRSDDQPEIRILVGHKEMVGADLVNYEVWRNPCKDAWRLDTTCKTEEEVKAASERIGKEGDAVLVIHRYRPKVR